MALRERRGSMRAHLESAGAPGSRAALNAASAAKLFDGISEVTTILAWRDQTDEMIRGLVRTTSEAGTAKPRLVADALRVLFRLFRQVT